MRLVLALLALVASADRVRAWTDTRVEGASSHLEVQHDGDLKVGLFIKVRIRGGWLSRFEIEGLGTGARLDPTKPVYLISDAGEKYRPGAELDGQGRLRITFPHRRAAPRRGRYEIGVHYTASPNRTELEPTRTRLTWEMPAWRVGLENVDLWITAPSGTRVPVDEMVSVQTRNWRAGTLVLHHLKRAQVPRTLSWSIALDVPSDALSPTEATVDRAPDPSAPDSPTGARDPRHAFLAGLLTVICLLKQALHPLWCRHPKRFLVPLGGRSRRPHGPGAQHRRWLTCMGGARGRALATIALAATTILALPRFPWLAQLALALQVVLSIERPQTQLIPVATGPLLRLTPAELEVHRQRQLAHWFGPDSWLDVTRPAGAIVLVCLWAAVCWFQTSRTIGPTATYAGWLATALFFTGTRLNSPPTADDVAIRLARLGRRLREVHTLSAEPVAGRARATGTVGDTRLALTPPQPPAGLLRLDCVVATTPWFERQRHEFAWLAVVQSGSDAEVKLTAALPYARRVASPAGTTTLLALAADPQTEAPQLMQRLQAWAMEGGSGADGPPAQPAKTSFAA